MTTVLHIVSRSESSSVLIYSGSEAAGEADPFLSAEWRKTTLWNDYPSFALLTIKRKDLQHLIG